MTRFRPGIAPTLVVLALLPLLVFLGFWQLARGEQKRVLLDSYAQRQAAAPVTAVTPASCGSVQPNPPSV